MGKLRIITSVLFRPFETNMSNFLRQSTGLAHRMSIASALRRSINSSSSAQKDFVQELYLRELKSYKPTPQSPQALQNQVRDFTMPSAPSAPAIPTAQDLAQELQTWDSASLVNNDSKPAPVSEVEPSSQSADEFLAFLERDHPPVAH